MPRPARFLLSKSFYHIMARGNNKNTIFRKEADYLYYLYLLDRFKLELPFNLYHYCLMPTHVHMLVQTKNANDFSMFMRKINLAYYHHYNRDYGWTGHFWQDRFKSKAVGKDEYFIQCGKYIELNPVRKGITRDVKDYPYSSYGHYAMGEFNKLITDDFNYLDLAQSENERQEAYRAMIVGKIVVESYSEKVWGSTNQRYREADKVNRKFKKV